jgi:hypothetical protein
MRSIKKNIKKYKNKSRIKRNTKNKNNTKKKYYRLKILKKSKKKGGSADTYNFKTFINLKAFKDYTLHTSIESLKTYLFEDKGDKIIKYSKVIRPKIKPYKANYTTSSGLNNLTTFTLLNGEEKIKLFPVEEMRILKNYMIYIFNKINIMIKNYKNIGNYEKFSENTTSFEINEKKFKPLNLVLKGGKGSKSWFDENGNFYFKSDDKIFMSLFLSYFYLLEISDRLALYYFMAYKISKPIKKYKLLKFNFKKMKIEAAKKKNFLSKILPGVKEYFNDLPKNEFEGINFFEQQKNLYNSNQFKIENLHYYLYYILIHLPTPTGKNATKIIKKIQAIPLKSEPEPEPEPEPIPEPQLPPTNPNPENQKFIDFILNFDRKMCKETATHTASEYENQDHNKKFYNYIFKKLDGIQIKNTVYKIPNLLLRIKNDNQLQSLLNFFNKIYHFYNNQKNLRYEEFHRELIRLISKRYLFECNKGNTDPQELLDEKCKKDYKVNFLNKNFTTVYYSIGEPGLCWQKITGKNLTKYDTESKLIEFLKSLKDFKEQNTKQYLEGLTYEMLKNEDKDISKKYEIDIEYIKDLKNYFNIS